MVLVAPSCEDEEETVRKEVALMEETRKEIRKEFESEYLTEASLFAYETSARQKLIDFYDYLNILSDTLQSPEFRQKASEMILKKFISTPLVLNFTDSDTKPKKVSITRFVESLLNNQIFIPEVSVDSIYVLEPLHRIETLKYTGKLGFKQNILNAPETGTKDRTADFYLEKEIKTFGRDTLNVWNIRLGSIF
jgi:hypothetical protein